MELYMRTEEKKKGEGLAKNAVLFREYIYKIFFLLGCVFRRQCSYIEAGKIQQREWEWLGGRDGGCVCQDCCCV